MRAAARMFAILAGALSACAPPAEVTSVIAEIPGDGSPPAWGRAPFPSDAHRIDGHLVAPAGLERLFSNRSADVAAHLATLDGFGLRPAIEFPLDGPIDPSTVDGRARVIGPGGVEVPYVWRYIDERVAIAGAPELGVVLEPGATYTAHLEPGILDVDGRPLAGVDRARTTFTTQRAQRTARAGRALLGSGAVAAPSITFGDPELVFSGPEALDRLLGVAARRSDGSERWGSSNPTGIAHDHVGAVATGVLELTRFRRADTGTDDPDDETFAIDPETGAPIPASVDAIPVTLIVPAAAPPPDGYPVAIIGHGLGSSRHAMLTFAEPLTAAGFALIAIDADGHGSRWDDVDRYNNLATALDAFSGEAEMRDGFGDRTGLLSTFDFLENLDNFSGARDAVLQSVLDLSQLIAALRGDLDLGPLGDARLDPSSVAYLGESFGTITGGILAAIEPDVDLYILDVPAAGIIDLSIINSPALATVLTPLAIARYGLGGSLDRFHPAVSLLQAMLDAADPLSYAPDVLAGRSPGPRHVIAIEVRGDEVLHNVGSESLALALGLDAVAPHASLLPGIVSLEAPVAGNRDGQTAALVQYGPATHGANWSSERGTLEYVPGFPHPGDNPFPRLPEPVEIANPIVATLELVVRALESHRDGRAPVVDPAAPPRRSR